MNRTCGTDTFLTLMFKYDSVTLSLTLKLARHEDAVSNDFKYKIQIYLVDVNWFWTWDFNTLLTVDHASAQLVVVHHSYSFFCLILPAGSCKEMSVLSASDLLRVLA